MLCRQTHEASITKNGAEIYDVSIVTAGKNVNDVAGEAMDCGQSILISPAVVLRSWGPSDSTETFAPHIDQPFRILLDCEPVELLLSEVEVSKADPPLPEMRRPFTLIFKGPRDKPLGEGFYEVENDAAGAHQLYLIPILSIGEQQAYQAVFN